MTDFTIKPDNSTIGVTFRDVWPEPIADEAKTETEPTVEEETDGQDS